ncbi:MAG: hypothetical protein JRJ23_07100 [Deltaproteobacteria bacterium]|nr:hypothetical protein [Deltaproteobacteria bacterium]
MPKKIISTIRDNQQKGSISKHKRLPAGPEKDSGKTGLLKRFFDWITRGVDKSRIGSTSCPT